MDEKMIAFIICMNNEMEFLECRNYLDRLRIPEGYCMDVIAVQEAPSMAAGYNAGMECTDAKYKVYLHQDVFIKNTDFLYDLLEVFQGEKEIGAFGVIGRRKLPEELYEAAEWDTGKILYNGADPRMEFLEETGKNQEVEAVDGLLIATQYDVRWREDIFDGWDFYDISQCMEYHRKGYKVVVPFQSEPWCYHDNQYSRLEKYYEYQQKFCEEYADIRAFHSVTTGERKRELEKLLDEAGEKMVRLIDQGEKKEVNDFFSEIGNTMYFSLREWSAVSEIDRLETGNGESALFWKAGMTSQQLAEKLRMLKYRMKRIEYQIEGMEENMEWIVTNYSVFAVAVVCKVYVERCKEVIDKMSGYYECRNMVRERNVLEMVRQQICG